MIVLLSIGDFSRTTYLSVKALRHYHDVGILEPARVDPASGYRYYAADQVGPAQTIRRLRELGMPLSEVKTIVRAPDAATRDHALVTHLQRLEDQLQKTQHSVASLRAVLQQPDADDRVEQHELPATAAIAITEHVRAADAVAWWVDAFTLLHQCLRQRALTRSGADGTLFPSEFFEAEAGELVAFIPVAAAPPADGAGKSELPARVRATDIPGAQSAVLIHDGPFGDLDLTYGALGRWVLERSIGADGPIREYFHPLGDADDLLNHATEACWPLTRATAGPYPAGEKGRNS